MCYLSAVIIITVIIIVMYCNYLVSLLCFCILVFPTFMFPSFPFYPPLDDGQQLCLTLYIYKNKVVLRRQGVVVSQKNICMVFKSHYQKKLLLHSGQTVYMKSKWSNLIRYCIHCPSRSIQKLPLYRESAGYIFI